jgi:hypothetical protein
LQQKNIQGLKQKNHELTRTKMMIKPLYFYPSNKLPTNVLSLTFDDQIVILFLISNVSVKKREMVLVGLS